MLMGMGTHFHIAPSELNTPTPNNGSINLLTTAPNKDLVSISQCKAEMTEETFLVMIEVGRKDELKVFRLTEDTEKQYGCTDFDVLRLYCENLYGSGRLETFFASNRTTDMISEQRPQVEGVSELHDPILKDVALSGLSVWL
jgi:hypothetical protein